MLEFKINEKIKLKLEEGKTSIYVNNKLFIQCKYLLITFPQKRETKKKFKSIDDLYTLYDSRLEQSEALDSVKLSPEEEFWGHCSNLEAWVVYDYDTRLLHSNLAFPLLKELADSGDTKAKLRLKEEIIYRLKSNSVNVINIFLEDDYFKYLSKEELIYGILKAEEARYLEEIEELTMNNLGLVESLEILRNSNPNGALGHFSVKKGQIAELDLLFDKYKKEELPAPINKLQNLEILYLHINEFNKTFPTPRKELKTIKELRIFSYGPTIIPDSFDKYPNLINLYISGGIFEENPESIGKLKYLKILSINYSQLGKLPDSICNLKSLVCLDLKNSSIKILPKEITKIDSLEALIVNPNIITSSISTWLKSKNLYKTFSDNRYVVYQKKP